MGKKIETPTVIHGFKGFTKDFMCRDKQYAPETTFEEDGDIKLCEHGLHFCEYPLDVFGYYGPGLLSRYCAVETDCASPKTHSAGSKRVTRKLSIGVEIGIPGIVQEAVNYVLERVTPEKTESNTGCQSAATNTGDRSAATNTGNQSAATNTGYRSAATNTGDQSAATNTGYRSAATNTGDQSAATNTGNRSAATNTGYQSAATNTGYRSAATNTGDRSAASVEGAHSVAISTGKDGRAKGSLGCGICCVERDEDDGRILAIKATIVDGKTIKADIWYSLKNGEFVEVE